MAASEALNGKVILVTGASRGLGRALGEDFAAAGARVALCARTAGPLEEAAAAIRADTGAEVLARPVDVADAGAVRDLVAEVERRWGPVAVLVNNASLLGPRVPLRDHPLDEWRRVLEVNLTGALAVCQAVLPGMRAASDGVIINITSGVGNTPRADWGAYAISKWGIEALTWNLALEEREAGIRVNAVNPGAMRTEMRAAAYPEEDPATLPEPGEVTGVFIWLASDAAPDVTGRRFDAHGWHPDGGA